MTPRPGRGTFVAAPRRERDAPPDLGWQEVALGGPGPGTGGLMELLALPPEGALALSSRLPRPGAAADGRARDLAARAPARRPGAWERPAIEGVAALRAWFARSAGGRFTAHDVVICPGGQAALVTAVRALASRRRDGAGRVADLPRRARRDPRRGPDAAAGAERRRRHPPGAAGRGARADRRARHLPAAAAREPARRGPRAGAPGPRCSRIAAAAGAFLIEDDWARDLDHRRPGAAAAGGRRRRRPRRLRPLAEQAGLAGAARRGRGRARAGGRAAARGADRRGPVRQRAAPARRARPRVLTGLAAAPEGAAGWGCASAATRSSARSSATSAGRRSTACPRGGLHLWLRLPDGTDEPALIAAAARAGVIVSGCVPSFAAEPTGPHLRLTFGGAPPDVLVEGVGRLARLL